MTAPSTATYLRMVSMYDSPCVTKQTYTLNTVAIWSKRKGWW